MLDSSKTSEMTRLRSADERLGDRSGEMDPSSHNGIDGIEMLLILRSGRRLF